MSPALRRIAHTVAALSFATLALTTTPQAAATTAVRVTIEHDVDPNGALRFEAFTDARWAEITDPGGAYAKARAGYGDHGAYATVAGPSNTLSAYGESFWIDSFTLGSGGGAGVLDIRVLVRGTLIDANGPGRIGSNAFYRLFISRSPMSCDFEDAVCTGSNVIAPMDGVSGEQVVTAAVPFTYGETFYIGSYLGAEALGQGTADFYGSAHFGATAPDGTALIGASGAAYPLAASVPEPAAAYLLLAGLLALGWTGRRAVQGRGGPVTP